MTNKCSDCFYKKIDHNGWCYMLKYPPKKKCGKFKSYPNTVEDKIRAGKDPFWETVYRSAEGLG